MSHVLTANRLRTGEVVYLTRHDTWHTDIAHAQIADDETAWVEIEAAGAAAVAANEIVGPYLIDVTLESGTPKPLSVREVIRAQHAPTV